MPRMSVATIRAGLPRCAGQLPVLAAVALVAGGVMARPAEAAGPTVEYALGLRPSQKDVDYDRADGDAAKNATIKTEKVGAVSAFVVRGASGEILRVFADTNADNVIDTVLSLTGAVTLTAADFV